MECAKEAKRQGKQLGTTEYSFASDSYSKKGCYFYAETYGGSPKNTAYFGTGGSIFEILSNSNGVDIDAKKRKSIRKACLVSGSIKIYFITLVKL